MRATLVFLLGMVLGLWVKLIASDPDSAAARPADRAPDGARRAPAVPPSAPAPDADVLTEIVGIGRVFEQALQEIGIVRYAQLAQQDADGLAAALGGRVTAERIRRERWIEQARERAGE